QLKVVANYAVGFNNVDLDEAKKRGIWVTNTPDVLTDATADIAFGLILSVTRRFHEAEDDLRAGGFLGWAPDYMLGRSLRGKTLGLLGFGRIGQATARRAAAFGMKIRFYSPSPKSLKSFGSTDIAAASFDEIIEQSDVLSLHLPLSAATHHLLNRQALFAMKKGAFLINTSRGPLVDEGALAEALHEGHLGGAGLDVFEKEPLVHERLLSAPRATLLPHIGSADIETRRAMTQLAVDNIIAILEGREPLTPVFKLSGEENE
ncbi:D-glycerate dehydrogenase, partial [Myxococcota bacterium]|nr:D-glycerate dehydrogenase [Myxococcota bacterium]